MSKVKSYVNLEELADGAFAEKLNEALSQVAENIQNPNTDAAAKRAINVTIKFAPNKTRQIVNTQINVTTKLAATEAIDTQMVMGINMRTGEVEIAEYDGQIRGQMSMDDLQGTPKGQAASTTDTPYDVPAGTVQQPEAQGKPLDLRSRNRLRQQKENAAAATEPDFNPETGEIHENDRRTDGGHTEDKVVAINKKAGQA